MNNGVPTVCVPIYKAFNWMESYNILTTYPPECCRHQEAEIVRDMYNKGKV